ncbi:NACHT domain-containing protein [Pseudomonas sp. COR58]|uniref:NACHT domain-containing protein n=1 Tax=Pseudomonas ekonensis TaxID=2842353 RepID=A0ABS6P7E7_9PSED|nr:AAA family ATPase [Pseudomonas ekonensis]MBV4456393.1 NACHT domain-containing protein [Pseudomonas ekonensis]
MNMTPDSNPRGSAGGAASTGGAVYAGSVGAWCAVEMLLGNAASLPWKLSDRHSIVSITCESSTQVDDLVLRLLPEGSVYIQVKHGLVMGPEFDKAMYQMVRQFWSDGFSRTEDRLVIATDSSASGTVRVAVPQVLSSCRDLASDAKLEGCVTSEATGAAFKRLRTCFVDESKRLKKTDADIEEGFRGFLGCTHLTVFDTLLDLARHHAIEKLRQVVDPQQAPQAWVQLNDTCLDMARNRKSVDRPGLWNILRRERIDVSHHRLSLAGMQVRLEDIFRGMTEQRIDQLMALGKFTPDLYVPRVDLDRHLERFRARSESLMVIVGGSGQGKTSWCAQCSRALTERPTLLIAAESLEVGDASLNDSLSRLIGRYVHEHGGYPLQAPELSQWLNRTPLLVIIDGLDRAPSFSGHLHRWVDASLAQLTQSQLQLVLTGRPETMERLKAPLELSERVYQPQKGSRQILLKDFSEEEALAAAGLLGDVGLARYRHPSMMSFCAQIRARSDVELEETQIVDGFIGHRLGQAINEHDLLNERLERFVWRFAHALAHSEQGVLSGAEAFDVPGFDESAYEALRRINFIVQAEDVLRIEPDQVSERLQGRHLDVAKSIAGLGLIKAFPLKVGALRFALADLARRDAGQAKVQLALLVEHAGQERMGIARSLACSTFDALPDWGSLEPLAAQLGKGYPGNSISLMFDSGSVLLDLMASARWTAGQRVRLLWTLATTESGYDWRHRHWRRIDREPNFHVTPWRKRMLAAIQDPQSDAWRFLIERFDSQAAFEDCNEANLGHLAQGLFFLGAETCTWTALQALTQSEGKESADMMEMLAREYAGQVLDLMAQVQASALFGLRHKQALARGLSALPVSPAIAQAASGLMAATDDPELRTTCLRMLARGGDAASVRELISAPDLADVDVAVCLGYSGAQFQAFAERVFERVLQREVDVQALSGFHYGLGAPEQIGAHFAVLAPLFTQVLERLPEAANPVALILESYIRKAIDHDATWPGVFELAERVLFSEDVDARRKIIYACTGEDSDAPGIEGQRLRTRMIEALVERETDPENLELLQVKLLSDQIGHPDAPRWLSRMMGKQADVPSEDTVMLAGFRGAEAQRIEEVVDAARSLLEGETAL